MLCFLVLSVDQLSMEYVWVSTGGLEGGYRVQAEVVGLVSLCLCYIEFYVF